MIPNRSFKDRLRAIYEPKRITWSYRAKIILSAITLAIQVVARGHPRYVIRSVIISLSRAIIPIISLWLLKQAVDLADSNSDLPTITTVMLALGYFLASAIGILIDRIGATTLQVTSRTIVHNIDGRLVDRVANIPTLTMFELPSFYDSYALASRGGGPLIVSTFDDLAMLGTSVVTMLVAFFALGQLSPKLIALVMVTTVPSVVINLMASERALLLARGTAEIERLMQYWREVLTTKPFGAELRLYGLRMEWMQRWHAAFFAKLDQESIHLFWRARIQTVASLLSLGGLSVGLYYLLQQADGGKSSAGNLIFYFGLVQQLAGAVAGLCAVIGRLHESGLYMDEFVRFVAGGHDELISEATEGDGALLVHVLNASFTYPGAIQAACHDANLLLRPGEWVVIMGPNGSGKSTLAKMVVGVYEPSSGSITVAHRSDLVGRHVSTGTIVYVEQRPIGYRLSVRDNVSVSYWQGRHDTVRIEHALAIVGLSEKVESLPLGIDTLVGKEQVGGIELSGGEWQRLALARAVFARPQLLVMDEPTSALDPASEADIMKRLRFALPDTTAMIITHRDGPVAIADAVIRMEKGCIIDNHSPK